MKCNKLFICLATCLFFILNFIISPLIAQDSPVSIQNTSVKTIYNFPPPMDGADFPFTIVTIEENTPEWARLLYQFNPNIGNIREMYFQWRQKNPAIKNGHTRNFRKLSGYLAFNDYVNEDGFIEIPTNEAVKAESNKILKDRVKFKKQQTTSTARNTNNTTWQLLGPTFMKSTSGTVTDRQINIYSITQSLSNKDILYSASEAGGTVFKTIDHGDNWFSISDNLITSMGARNIEVAPSDPNIVYLCTRDDIYKTTTGNDAWVSVYNEYKSNNRTLIIHPTDPNLVLTGGDNGILRSTDGGTNWTNPLPAKAIYDLRYKPEDKPEDTQTIYALVKNDATNLTEFYKSTDGGETWSIRTTGWPTEAANSTNGGQMTTSDGNDSYIYAFIGATWTNADNSRNIKIMKSLDYGESWTTAVDYDNDFGINSGQGYYDWDIEMSDTNPDVVFGGTQGRWVTRDGFQTIHKSGGSLGHSDVQETLFNGTDLWVVNDGGIILFDDENFDNYTAKSKGINAISYWSFDQGWNKDVTSGTHYHNGTSVTHENYESKVGITLGGAEPSFSLVAQPSGDKMVSKGYGSVNGYMMPETQDGTYSRFSYNLTPNIHYYSGNNVGVHPTAYETHFLGLNNDLMKSTDFGVTWKTIYTFPLASELVWDVELTRANTNALFISTIDDSGGNIYRSLDNGQSFVEINLPSQFSNNPKIMNISVSNEDENVFYVMGDRSGVKIAKTIDGGTTWIDLDTPALDDYDGHKIMQVDGTDGGIYLMTTRAVFYRNNTLADWVAMTEGMPANTSYNYIRPFYRDKELRIATSRGIYEAELYDTPQFSDILVQPTVQKIKTTCARDTFYFDDFSVLEHTGATWTWNFHGATYVSATNIRNPKVVYGNTGQFDVTLSINKGGQNYTKTIEKMVEVGNACTSVDDFAGKSLKLNRATSDRAITDDLGVTTNTFTFSAWIKPTESFQAFQGVFSNGVWCAHCNEETIGLIMNYWGDRLYYRWPGSTSSWAGASNLYPKLNEWSYVAFVLSPDKVTLYLNEEKWESTISHDPAAIGKLYLGFGHYSKNFNGEIEEATFWNRSLTDSEIKELMHFTKDPTSDPDLLAYYQFNEEEGDILDKAGTATARLLNNAQRVTSSAPVGKGSSNTQTEATGNITFGTTDFEANFINQSGIETVASKINNAPYNLNGLLTSDTPLAEEYWAIHRYGTGDFTADLTFKTSVNISTADADNTCQYGLYKRGNRSDEDWTFVTGANAVDATTDKITFSIAVDEWAQYLVVKSSQAVLRAISPVLLKNTVSGTTSLESSYIFSAANLSENVQITAPTDFEISTSAGTGFTNSLTLTPSGGKIANTIIYVRFSPTESRLYTGNITHTSAGASDLLVEINGTGIELDCFPGTTLDMDGSNDYVYIPVNDLALGDKMTLEFWSDYRGSMSSNTSILEALDKNGNRVINLHFPWSNSRIYFDGGNVDDDYDRIDKSVTEAEISGWNHWAFVKDATTGTMEIYRNGILWHSGTGKTRPFAIITDLYLGRREGGNYNNCRLDELKIWNTIRTETEIREYLHLTAKGDEVGLMTYFQFNETSGEVVDKIGNISGELKNGASKTIATQPVGCGFSNTQISPSGSTTFTNTDIEADYSATTDNVVASKLDLSPNDDVGISAGESAADQQYWVVNHYGGANDMNANLTFTLGEGIADTETASTIKLYGRSQTSDGDWTFIAAANSIDDDTNTATFNTVTTYQQYLITKASFAKISIDKTSLSFGNVTVGTNSVIDSIMVDGTDLTASVNIIAPSSFEISLMPDVGYTNSLTLSLAGNTLATTTIYVRFSPTIDGYQTSDITLSSTGLSDRIISVDGTGVNPEIEIRQNATILASGGNVDFSNQAAGASTSHIFTIKNSGLGVLSLPNLPTITVSGTNASDFTVTESPGDTSLATNESTTFKVTFTPSTSGAKSAIINLVNNDSDENPYTLTLSGSGDPIPIITVSTLSDFGNTLIGNTSAEQTYTVSGVNLREKVMITSTFNFEISLTSSSGFSSFIELDPTNGILANTAIYVRYSPSAVSNITGILSHTSTGAVLKTISVTANSSKEAETIPDKAVSFNGISDYVNITHDPILDFGTSTDFTVALWAKSQSSVIWATMASNTDWDSGSNNGWNIGLGSDGKSVDVNVGDGSNRADLEAGDISDGEWHHIAATFDRDGAVSLYIDGVLAQSTSMTSVGDITSGLPLTFGRDAENEYFFKGVIDEAKIWNAALTAEQVREAMHLTSQLNTSNLIAYYQFNEPSHIPVYNLSGNIHGALVGGTRPVSTVPVGGGFAGTKTESNGSISFTDTDVDINFTAQNSAEVVVSKINLAPNIVPTGLARIFNNQYWAIHRYGTGVFAGNITFKVAGDLTAEDQEMPDDILLYGRNFNSDTDWALVTAATAVDATNDKATFDAISNFDQFIVVSSSNGETAPTDCIPNIHYENRDDLPDVTSSSTYIEAGNLNGTGEAIIRSGQNKLFRAKEYITLMPGFTVEAGASFTAIIEDCGATLRDTTDNVETARVVPITPSIKIEQETDVEMNTYPNPFESHFFIDYKINKEAVVTIQLFDTSGKNVRDILLHKKKKAGTYKAQFTNRNLAAGTYIVVVQIDDQISQRKVMMSRHK